MLKEFEIEESQTMALDTTPRTQAMKNALAIIGNPKSDLKIRNGKLTDFGKKLTFSKFL